MEERINYQKKQEKNYRSGLARIAEAKRLGVKFKLTNQEQDAFDYFNGEFAHITHVEIKGAVSSSIRPKPTIIKQAKKFVNTLTKCYPYYTLVK